MWCGEKREGAVIETMMDGQKKQDRIGGHFPEGIRRGPVQVGPYEVRCHVLYSDPNSIK
jgi:hypothetical protein